MSLSRLIAKIAIGISCVFLCSCAHVKTGTGAETWTGRRWYVHAPEAACRFWGYLKRPGEPWRKARLVILDERNGVRPPDRAPAPPGPPYYGDDHNFEYEVHGQFTGKRAYDPNSDLELPLFMARSFRLLNPNPGPLPGVGKPQQNGFIPAREAGKRLSTRLP